MQQTKLDDLRDLSIYFSNPSRLLRFQGIFNDSDMIFQMVLERIFFWAYSEVALPVSFMEIWIY